MKLLALDKVTVTYDGIHEVLKNADLEVFSGDFIGIVGPNGGGKTTLVKAILGMVPYSGHIWFADGLGVSNGSIGYLPQQTSFDKAFPITVSEVVLSGLQSRRRLWMRITRAERIRAKELLELAGISHLSGHSIGKVSGGEMQKALLCRALIASPKVLLLDEPANFIDAEFEKDMYSILTSFNDRMAIIMVSHDMDMLAGRVKSILHVHKTAEFYRNANDFPGISASM